MSETPRTWTLQGDVVGVPHEPITRVSGPYVDISEKFEVVEKSLVDAERERMLDLLERVREVQADADARLKVYVDIEALLREQGRLSEETSRV
jgi:hypothetical protein